MTPFISELLSALVVILLFVALPVIGLIYSIRRSSQFQAKRDQMLKNKFGQDVEVIRGFPINQRVEEIIQGGLSRVFQDYRELIVHDNWLYIQLTAKAISPLTMTEERNYAHTCLFARQLDELTPHIAIRNVHNRSFVSRIVQDKVKNSELIWCEAAFDVHHNIYNEPDSQVDTLSILSPEVLQRLLSPPGNADIILKRNQLYYILPGNKPAEKILAELLVHSENVAKELNENLHRWAQSMANTEKLKHIADSELSVTLREHAERKIFWQ